MQGGDDLDDDFVPDELVALSDGEEPTAAGSPHSPSDPEDDAPSADEFAEGGNEGQSKSSAVKEKKRKRREKEKERKAKVRCFEVIGYMLLFVFK